MLDREIMLTGVQPENAALKPTARIARVERKCAIDQPDHRTEVLAESRQHDGGVGEDARVVLNRARPPRSSDPAPPQRATALVDTAQDETNGLHESWHARNPGTEEAKPLHDRCMG